MFRNYSLTSTIIQNSYNFSNEHRLMTLSRNTNTKHCSKILWNTIQIKITISIQFKSRIPIIKYNLSRMKDFRTIGFSFPIFTLKFKVSIFLNYRRTVSISFNRTIFIKFSPRLPIIIRELNLTFKIHTLNISLGPFNNPFFVQRNSSGL